MNREARRMCLRWITQYLILQQKKRVCLKPRDVVKAFDLPPGSCGKISHYLKKACYSRNNLGFSVALHNNSDCKSYAITIRPTFDRLAEKILDD